MCFETIYLLISQFVLVCYQHCAIQHFDNLGQALMSLFVLSSKDGWVSIMYQGLDAVGPDQQVRSKNWFLDTQFFLGGRS